MTTSSNLLIDTHIWFWYMTSDPQLNRNDVTIITDHLRNNNQLLLSTISILEIAKLAQKQRIKLNQPTKHWVEEALNIKGVVCAPVDEQVALASCDLAMPLHKDPADRLLIATALVYRAKIMTYDKLSRSYIKKHYPYLLL